VALKIGLHIQDRNEKSFILSLETRKKDKLNVLKILILRQRRERNAAEQEISLFKIKQFY